jgi:hypothetical protein
VDYRPVLIFVFLGNFADDENSEPPTSNTYTEPVGFGLAVTGIDDYSKRKKVSMEESVSPLKRAHWSLAAGGGSLGRTRHD